MLTKEDMEREIKKNKLREVDYNTEQPSMRFGRPGEGGLKPGDYIFPEGSKLYNENVVINGEEILDDNGNPVVTMVAFVARAKKSGNGRNAKWQADGEGVEKVYLSFLRKRFEIADEDGEGTDEYKESSGSVVDDTFNTNSWQEAWENVLVGRAFNVDKEDFKGFRYNDEKPRNCRVYVVNWL